MLAAGCSSPPPPEPPPPPPAPSASLEVDPGPAEPEPLPTGIDCTKAEVLCDGGVCTATLANNCEKPVSCSLSVVAICNSAEGAVEAKGRGRTTLAAGVEEKLQAKADCQGAPIMATQPDEVTCR